MKLNHINLAVTDVLATSQFLKKYFGMRNMAGEEDDSKFNVLFDDDHLVLSLIKVGQVKYPATFHIGFIQPSEARVNEINQRLKDDGFDVESPQRLHAWTFYVQTPGGFMVEVLC